MTALLSFALAGCVGGIAPRGRYHLATDPGSRYGFRYVRDRQSGLWVQRECEVRVDLHRQLPDPLSDDAHGDRLHSQQFAPGSAGTGSLVPKRFVVRDGYRVWRFADVLGEDDLRGRTGIGIQVEWPEDGAPSRWEPMEVFGFPPLTDQPPDTWTPWERAAGQRAGAFGWWEEAQGEPETPAVPVAHPFELRWRLRLRDTLVVDDVSPAEPDTR